MIEIGVAGSGGFLHRSGPFGSLLTPHPTSFFHPEVTIAIDLEDRDPRFSPGRLGCPKWRAASLALRSHEELCSDNASDLTIKPERTFWDKIIILHGQRHWFQNRGELYKDGQRLSRHYYDVFRLLASEHGDVALADLKLAESCAKHARLYFDRRPLDLD